MLSQELSEFKLGDIGAEQNWEEVDSWGKHVMGESGIEGCLESLHEKIVGKR